nr:MAG TPA: hypothetical protein [Caudoviricetes sp.]
MGKGQPLKRPPEIFRQPFSFILHEPYLHHKKSIKNNILFNKIFYQK